jgi:hypothetical protein
MMKPNRWLMAACALVALSVASLRASDMNGIYGLIDRVVLEPSDAAAARVQIWGAFALSDRKDGVSYLAPVRGYLYYSCPAGKETTCRSEWADLKSLAAAKTAAGFGGRYLPAGRVRPAAEAVASPDVYPIQMGVMKITPFQVDAGLLKKLQDAPAAK